MRVEAAGERPEGGQDDLARRNDEAAPRDPPPFEVDAQLGMEVAGHFRARVAAHRLVAEDDAGQLDFLCELAAATVGD